MVLLPSRPGLLPAACPPSPTFLPALPALAPHPIPFPNLPPSQDINPNNEGLLADLLWADPSPHVTGWCRNPRGVSYIFGLDVAREWLARQGLKAIVRAHMVQAAGYEVLGDSQVITVFSAANYRNSGACVLGRARLLAACLPAGVACGGIAGQASRAELSLPNNVLVGLPARPSTSS